MKQNFTDSLRSPPALARFALVAGIGLAADLWTKWLAFHTLLTDLTRLPNNTYLVTSRTYDLIPNGLRFEVTVNQGAVFGIGQGQRFLFLIVSAAAVAFLIYLFLSSKPKQWFYQIVLGMLLAGVLGNVYDRALYGYVRDMIHVLPGWPNPLRSYFPTWQYIFPWIFNIADSFLCVGVTLMLLYTLLSPSRQPGDDDPKDAPDSQPARSQSQQA